MRDNFDLTPVLMDDNQVMLSNRIKSADKALGYDPVRMKSVSVAVQTMSP